jgi:hypothetical protein
MARLQTLADFLGTEPSPLEEEGVDVTTLTVKEFCRGVLTSREYRQSILDRVTRGTLPPAIECRMYDYAYGKPVEHVEHTGEHGQPIEVITRVVRVIVDPELDDYVPETTVMH